ncbi:MAG TPA: RNA polymerase sigma factor [Solirubrobacteraceae bacterium]|nr:RNA polymerase sigma factor [Solirubrobacteraceae bacterium]
MRFELLYAKYAPAVKAYVLRRADASTADDVVAEVFVVCWRRFDDVPIDPLPWLLGVARRVLSTQWRGERRRGALYERLAGQAGEGVDDASEDFVAAVPTDFATRTSADIAGDLTDGAASASRYPGDGALAGVTDPALAAALARLNDADRELLLLIAWDGLSPAEAATALDIKPATGRVRLLRARRRLTQALSRERSDPTTCSSLSIEASS